MRRPDPTELECVAVQVGRAAQHLKEFVNVLHQVLPDAWQARANHAVLVAAELRFGAARMADLVAAIDQSERDMYALSSAMVDACRRVRAQSNDDTVAVALADQMENDLADLQSTLSERRMNPLAFVEG